MIDDDSVGGVSVGGEFCLAVSDGAVLETWAGQLSPDPTTGGARWAVTLFNRSPAMDAITLDFAKLPGLAQAAGSSFIVRDVWLNITTPTSAASYAANVGAHDTALLVVTQFV